MRLCYTEIVMISPARNKKELISASLITVIFFISSIFGLHLYLSEIDTLTNTNTVSAHHSEIRGIADEIKSSSSDLTTTVIPTKTSSSSAKLPISVTPSPIQNNGKKNSEITSQTTHTSVTSESNILAALNTYRQKNGIAPLIIDSTLQSFAQSRAEVFHSTGNMDNHVGFQSMLSDNGFAKMGFNSLGENSSYGEWGTAQNLIEVIYGSSSAHNESQLRSDWTHVGIGVKGSATNLVFGGGKR